MSNSKPYHHGNLRQALADAGRDLAREGGPSAIVLREAARRVGVSNNAAYRHFDSRPDLIEAVALCARGSLVSSMQAEIARGGPTNDAFVSAVDVLIAAGRSYIQFALDEPGLFSTAFAAFDQRPLLSPSPWPGSWPDVSPSQLFAGALDGMIAAGILASGDRHAAATTAWAAVHGLSVLLLGPLGGMSGPARDALIESSLDLIGRGLISRN